jgi:hypothetical protein
VAIANSRFVADAVSLTMIRYSVFCKASVARLQASNYSTKGALAGPKVSTKAAFFDVSEGADCR